MGLLRSLIKIITGSIFTISLSLLIILTSFVQLTEYHNLKQVFIEIFTEQINATELTDFYYGIKAVCMVEEKVVFPINNITIELSCSEIENVKEKNFSQFIFSKIFDIIYFKEYPCEMIQCIKEIKDIKDLLVLFSYKANIFYKKLQSYLIGIVLIASFTFILSLKGIIGKIKGMGKSLVGVGISYFILLFVEKLVPIEIQKVKVKSIVMRIIQPTLQLFLYIFVLGMVLVVLSYLIERLKNKL